MSATITAFGGPLDGVVTALAEVERDLDLKIRQVLEYIGLQTVAYLRSLTSATRPPIRAGAAPRPAHPGGWADVSSDLAASYAYTIEPMAGGWALVLTNGMAYAAALEARDGFWVLSGVADPGGPVEVALRKAVAVLAPDWTIVRYD